MLSGKCHEERNTSKRWRLMPVMDVGRTAAVHRVSDGRVPGEVVFQIHDRLGASDEEDGVSVVQRPHLVRSEQLPAAHLEVGGPGTGASLTLTVGPGINGGFAQGLGDVLVGAGLY